MKRLIVMIVAAASLTLAGCLPEAGTVPAPATAGAAVVDAVAPSLGVPAPVEIADRTQGDEEAGRLLTVAYTAASTAAALAIQVGVASGKMSPATVRRIGELDARAFALVMGVRQAYLAANASSYSAALVEARLGIAQLLSAAKGGAL